MGLGHRMRRLPPLSFGLALLAGAASADARDLKSPEAPPRFPDRTETPLVEALAASGQSRPPFSYVQAIRSPPRDMGAFQRLADRRALAALAGSPPRSAAPPEAMSGAPSLEGPERAASSAEAPPSASSLPAAAPADPAVASALAAALDRLILREDGSNPLGGGDWAAGRAAIGAFYAARGFAPVWLDAGGPTPAGRSAIAAIARASEDGLSVPPLALPRDPGRPLGPEALAGAEIAVAAAVVAYAEQATGSRLSKRISPSLAGEPALADPGQALAETAAAADPGARLTDFNPPQRGYRALREALRSAGRRGARGAILANMEMWRLEPRDMGERRIEVNIPDFSVSLIDGDDVLMTSRVVVGKPATPTPVFSDRMRYVLINPSWQVPDSIIKKEMLSRLDHFQRLGYDVKTVGGRVTVRQPPGDDNALGRLAFMFPNDHAVYLHDTPAQALFDEDMRALSHGCVRVEDPVRLAELVLGWPEARLEAAIGGAERTVFLPQPLPIHIEYFTAFVEPGGAIEERPDVYGLTQRVARILSATGQD